MWACCMTPVLEITVDCSVGSCSKHSRQQLPANLVLPTPHVWKSGLHLAATWVNAEEITSHFFQGCSNVWADEQAVGNVTFHSQLMLLSKHPRIHGLWLAQFQAQHLHQLNSTT